MRKSLSKSLVILFISLFIFTNCSDSTNNTVEEMPKDELVPLAKGNYWKFERYSYDTSDPDKIYSYGTILVNVMDTILINGEVWYHGYDHSWAMKNDSNGYWEIIEDSVGNFKIEDARFKYKYPTSIGDNWGDSTVNYETIGLNIPVKVIIGTFNCIKYKISIQSSKYDYYRYYSQGIGLIKIVSIGDINENVVPPDTTVFIEELIEYNVNN